MVFVNSQIIRELSLSVQNLHLYHRGSRHGGSGSTALSNSGSKIFATRQTTMPGNDRSPLNNHPIDVLLPFVFAPQLRIRFSFR
jgi:hypothetical protein